MPSETPGYAAIRRLVRRTTTLWMKRLGLESYVIDHVFLDCQHEEDNIAAETSATPEYLRADMTWYLPTVLILTNEELVHRVVHECVHVLLAPEQQFMKDSQAKWMELATESVTRALERAWK